MATLDAALFWVPSKSSYADMSHAVLVALEAAEQSFSYFICSYNSLSKMGRRRGKRTRTC